MRKSNRNMIDDIKKGLAEKGVSSRSIVAFLLFGMIVLVFVLSDLNGRGGGGVHMGQAAEVNGEIISIKDFQEEENRLSQYYGQLFGGQFDLSSQRTMLRGEAMNSLVSKTLGAQAAEKEGIFATDAEIRYMITQELPYFKRDGAFQSDSYKAILAANHLTAGEFENKLRQDIKNQRSRQLFETAMTAGTLQKAAEKELKSSKLNIEYVALSPTEYAKNHEVTAAAVSAKLADPEFAKRVEAEFNANPSEFEGKEEIRASHILIKLDPASEEATLNKAQAALKRVRANEDFGKVAAEVSDDPGSKAKKGDLGFFTRGRMVKEFEAVAFTLPIGQISDLVKSSFGYHIIKVTEKKAFVKADFEKAKHVIAKRIIANEEYSSFIKSIEADMTAGKADAAIQTLAKNNMKWKESGYFDLAMEAVPGINSVPVMKASLELTKSSPLSKNLVRDGEVQYLLRLKDTKIDSGAVKAQDKELQEKQRSTDAYRLWVENFRKSAKIETNSTLVQSN